MKVLILNGSPQKEGFTVRLLKYIQEGITGVHTVEWINVYDLSLKPCMGCLRCRPNQACVLSRDDAQNIGRKIAEADALIVGTPTYWGNMTGALKNLFDRNVTTFEDFSGGKFPKPRQKGKRAIVVAVSAAPWPFNGSGAIDSVKRVLRGGAYRITGIINYGGTGSRKEIPLKIREKAKRLGSSLIKQGHKSVIS